MCITQGHYRRAVVLEKLGQTETAASSYLLCLHLGGMEHPVARLLSEVKGKTLEHTHMHAHNNNIYTCTIYIQMYYILYINITNILSLRLSTIYYVSCQTDRQTDRQVYHILAHLSSSQQTLFG